MRQSHMLSSSNLLSIKTLRSLACGITLAAGLAFVAGCESKSWLDPSEMGRYEHDPLQLRILDELEPGSEAPDDQFASAQDPRPEDLVATPQDYVISPNDVLSITIADLVSTGLETVRTVRVSDSGTISLPLLPNPVPAAGRTEHELQQEVVQAYIDANILVDRPQVSVQVAEARGRTYKILGAVARPNTYLILQSDYRLLDALVDAGDITSLGIENIYIVRKPIRGGPPPAPPVNGGNQPGAAPGRDPLAPQSRANTPMTVKPVAMLQQTPQAERGPRTGSESEGRYVIIDGKSVLVGNQGTAVNQGAEGAAAAQPEAAQQDNVQVAPAPFDPADAQPAAAQQAPRGGDFAFNEPTTGTDARIIRVPWEPLKNGELRYNIVVRPQDLIIVPQPELGIYYMGGHVANPGAYNIVPGNKVTLMDAVISARMLDQLAIPERTDIIRRTGPDRYMFVRVDLAKIFAGQQPDIYLKDNDKVMVGTNAVAPFLAAFRNAFRVTYGFGFLYDRNFAPAREFEGQ